MNDKLMVIGGGYEEVEVIDLSGRNRKCRKIANNSVNTFGTTGAFIADGYPIVCGGGFNSSLCMDFNYKV